MEAHAKGHECGVLEEDGGNKKDKGLERKVQDNDYYCLEERLPE
jgi:hypothetical protein